MPLVRVFRRSGVVKVYAVFAMALGLAVATALPACGSSGSDGSSGSTTGTGSGAAGGSGATAGTGSTAGTGATTSSGSTAGAASAGAVAGSGGGSGAAGTGTGSGASTSGASTSWASSGASTSGASTSGASSGTPSSGATGGTGASSGGSMDAGGGGEAGATSVILETTATKGQIIATGAGLSLYVYKPDTPQSGATPAKSTCTGACLTAWPLFYASPLTVPAGLNAADFGSFDRGAGVMQSTYMGWPLYRYKDDTKLGDVKGDGEGAVWFVVKVPFTAPK